MLATLFAIFCLVYLGLCVGIFVFQDKLIFFPSPTLQSTPETVSLAYEDVYLNSTDGNKIHGWYVPHENAKGHILFFHGNAGNVSHRIETLRIFHEIGLATLIIDYQGYGLSEGKPSEQNSYDDALAAWNYFIEERKIKPDTIIIHGRSLGGGVASWLASEKDHALLILESTFRSTVEMGKEIYPFLPISLISTTRFEIEKRIGNIQSPLMIIHSQQDNTVPFHHAEHLFRLAKQPKEFVEISGEHNGGFLLNETMYKQSLEDFISEHL